MHFNVKDISGMRFGNLTVVGITDERCSNGSVKWKCKCDCGNECYATSSELKRRRKSCGCKTRLVDLSGRRFGRLIVLERAESKNGSTYWKCICDCGTEKEICASHLSSGKIVSCGCLSVERFSKINKTHGMSNTRIYNIWCGMKTRCYDKNCESYKNYGDRGITICREWLDDFMNFYNWAMDNGYSDDLSIDRINVNGNYEPDNCRWSTRKEQSCNTRSTKLFNHNGKAKTLKQISLDEKINYNTLLKKVSENGNDVDKAIYEIKNRIRIKRKKV